MRDSDAETYLIAVLWRIRRSLVRQDMFRPFTEDRARSVGYVLRRDSDTRLWRWHLQDSERQGTRTFRTKREALEAFTQNAIAVRRNRAKR